MYRHSLLWHCLWLASPALQAIIVWLMIRRRLYREFPMFFLYTAFQVLLSPTLFVLDHLNAVTIEQYWYANWAGDSVNVMLRFAIIYEIFKNLFRSYSTLQNLGALLMRWTVVLLLLVAVLVSIYAPATADDHKILVGLKMLNRTVGLVQCGLVLFLFLFSSYFGLSWRSHLFGIGLGLGIFASAQLAVSTFIVQAGRNEMMGIVDIVWFGAYDSCVLIWLFYMLAPEPARRPVMGVPAHNLETWNLELQRLLQR
jgi:hypothetical protein